MPMPKQLEGKAVPISEQPNRGKGAGRKPKLVKKWVKECGMSREDARQMLNGLLHSYTLKDLNQLQKTEYAGISAATYIMIASIVRSGRKGDFSQLNEMYDFIFGKDEQKISVTACSPEYAELKDALLEAAANGAELEETIKTLAKAAGCEAEEG
jgi:hypothetical protein